MRIALQPLFGIALTALCASGAAGQATPKPPHSLQSLPPGYAGTASCLDCHAKEGAVFAGTVKGRVLINRPRDQH